MTNERRCFTGNVRHFAPDHLGSSSLATDANGNAIPVNSQGVRYYAYDSLDRLTSAYGQTFEYWATGRFKTFAGQSYGYDDPGPYHAVDRINGVDRYDYDANGNMTVRNKGTEQQTLEWNAENRLTKVKNASGGVIESYAYDADGSRIKTTSSGVTTRTFFPFYEEENGVAVKYYTFNGQRIAVRRGGTLSYLHTDHLGSSSLATDASGNAIPVNSQGVRYYAYGAVRSGDPATLQTDRTFTGQKADETGLLFFEARYYDPTLGTFVSPDTLVPEPGRVVDYNRFAYTRNNPLRYADPTGHRPDDGCETEGCTLPNGLAPDATWLLANGAYSNVDPQIVAAEDYNRGAAVLQAAGMLVAVAAVPGIIAAAAEYSGVGTTVVGTACADGDCTNELGGLARVSNSISSAAEEGMTIYVRSRPNVPRWVERFLQAKPVGAKTIINGPWGIRLTTRGLVYSDVDLAYVEQHGRIVTSSQAIQNIQDSINRAYGTAVVQHGDHFNGMLANAGGATMQKFIEHPFHAFTQSGYSGVVHPVRTVVEGLLDLLR